MRLREVSSLAFGLALLMVDAHHVAAQQDSRSTAERLADTFAVRAVLSQAITSQTPAAVIARLGLRSEDEQILRAELARYSEIETPLRERSDRLAREYAASPRAEAQTARLALEAERAELRTDTHARILQRLSDDGRSRWLARIGEARKQVMAGPPTPENSVLGLMRSNVRRAASTTVTGRLRHVTCNPALVLAVDTGTESLRLIVEDPATISVLGSSGGSTMLQCGAQDVPVRIGYDPVSGAANGVTGAVRVLDYRQP